MRGNPKFMRGKCFRLKLVVYVFKIQPIYSIIILDSYLLYFIFIMQYVSYHNLPYKNDYTKEYLVFIHNEITILQFFIVHIYKIAFMFFFYVYIYQILLYKHYYYLISFKIFNINLSFLFYYKIYIYI